MTRTDYRCIKTALYTQQFLKSIKNQEGRNITIYTAHLTTLGSLFIQYLQVDKNISGMNRSELAAVNILIRSQCINTLIFCFRCAKKYNTVEAQIQGQRGGEI